MANHPDKVQLERLSYVIYEHPDTAKFLTFADDFGFEVAGTPTKDNSEFFLRGYGADPYLYIGRQAPEGQGKRFIGAGFRARTSADFDKAAKLDGAEVTDLAGRRPGGGKMVTLKDVNGFDMQIVFYQEERQVPPKGISNVTGGNPHSNGAVNKERLGMWKTNLLLYLSAMADKNRRLQPHGKRPCQNPQAWPLRLHDRQLQGHMRMVHEPVQLCGIGYCRQARRAGPRTDVFLPCRPGQGLLRSPLPSCCWASWFWKGHVGPPLFL